MCKKDLEEAKWLKRRITETRYPHKIKRTNRSRILAKIIALRNLFEKSKK